MFVSSEQICITRNSTGSSSGEGEMILDKTSCHQEGKKPIVNGEYVNK